MVKQELEKEQRDKRELERQRDGDAGRQRGREIEGQTGLKIGIKF